MSLVTPPRHLLKRKGGGGIFFMIASIHIEIDDETGEVMMTSAGDGLALELANEIIELAVNGGIEDFIGDEIEVMSKQ